MRLFPDLARQDEIKFMFFKGLPYRMRIGLVVTGIALGLLVQLFVSFWLGWLLLALASGMSLVQGYDSTPVAKGTAEKWDQVTPDEYAKVRNKQGELRRWDLDAFDITNPLGGTFFAILLVLGVVVWLALLDQPGRVAEFWAWDASVMLVPHWLTGVRKYLRQDQLIIKIGLLEKVMGLLASPSDVQVLPMLATRATKEDKRFPVDARLMLRLVGAPAGFLGIQVQIAINSVQGTDYPYLYCVLLARNEARFFAKAKQAVTAFPGFDRSGVTVEPSSEQGVDVLVVRQTTTRTSGYHTDPARAQSLVSFAVQLARKLCLESQTGGRVST